MRDGGTFSFLFTDIEGSTRLLDALGDSYASVLDDHRRLMRAAVAAHNGAEQGTEGDSFFVVFERAEDAVHAAIDAQVALSRQAWPEGWPVRVRMGIHTGEATVHDGDYVGMAVHRAARISSAAHGGQLLLSETTRGAAVDVTTIDLGLHQLKDMAAPERLFQVVHPELEATFPPPRALDVRRHNIPESLTSFVGRAEELDELTSLVRTERLVTLTGPGGAGKTRLALETTRAIAERFADGAWLVELASLATDDLVPPAVAATFGLSEQPGRSATRALLDHFAERESLLVLDNCEHVLGATRSLVGELLRACPRLTVLATSRERLGVGGERAWPVPPLPARSDAVRLFIDRAVRPDVLDDASTIGDLCARLDGLPLAIELAAARTRVLSVSEIAARLDDRFRLLRGGTSDSSRQETLAATIGWSYELLDDSERALLRALSVFAGGWTLDAAERVSDAEVLDLLAQLIDKSMVGVEGSALGTRYRLLETIREYAHDRLNDADESHDVSAAHLAWMTDLVAEAEPEMLGADDLPWLSRFDLEIDNVRAALEWGCRHSTDRALALAGDLWPYWWMRGYMTEGREHLDAAIAAAGDNAPQLVRARAHAAAAFLAYCQGDADALTHHAEAAVALGGDGPEFAWSTGWALIDLGELAQQRGDLSTTRRHFERALAVAKRGNHLYTLARAHQQLGYLTDAEGRTDEALALAREGLRLMRVSGNRTGISRLLYCLARLHWGRGDADEARAAYEESLALSEEAGDKLGIRGAHQGLGTLAYERGDIETGRREFDMLLAATDAMGQPSSFRAHEFHTLAQVALGAGDGDAATEWLEQARRLAERCEDADLLREIDELSGSRAS